MAGWRSAPFISGIQLLRGRSSAIYWLFLTAGCGLYLGLMDVLFDLENGIYLVPKGGDPVAVGIEIAINFRWRNMTFGTKPDLNLSAVPQDQIAQRHPDPCPEGRHPALGAFLLAPRRANRHLVIEQAEQASSRPRGGMNKESSK